jgi:flagellar hook assembly protein FlgD
MRYIMLIFVFQFVIFASGCSGKVQVSGNITFPDGAPLTTGEIRFEADGFVAAGKIQPDGSYKLGSLKDNDGVPKGSYKVSIYALDYSNAKLENDPANTTHAIPLVAEKFLSTKTSGLVCNVNGKTKFNVTVEKPTRK